MVSAINNRRKAATNPWTVVSTIITVSDLISSGIYNSACDPVSVIASHLADQTYYINDVSLVTPPLT